MAVTINLAGYTDLAKKSYLGYDSKTKKVDFYSGTSVAAVASIGSVVSKTSLGGFIANVTLGKASVASVASENGFSVNTGSSSANWTITGGAGITAVTTGAGNDEVSLSSLAKAVTVTTGAGADKVSLSSLAAGVTATVDLGAGNDQFSLNGGAASVKLGDGADTVSVDKGTVTLTDYNAASDVINVAYSSDKVSGNTITLADGAVVKIASTSDGVYSAKFSNGTYVWADSTKLDAKSDVVDLSSYTANLTVDVSDAKAAVTVLGGSGNDNITIGSGQAAYGGKGTNNITLSGASDTEYVAFGTESYGTDSVTGFIFGTGAEADVVAFYGSATLADLASWKLDSDGTVTLGGNNNNAVVVNNSDSDGVVSLKAKYGTGTVTVDLVSGTLDINESHKASNVLAAATNSKTAAISYAGAVGSVVLDLGNSGFDKAYVGQEDGVTVYGKFATVTGGTADTKLLGNGKVAEVLVAAGGQTSLWGGGIASDTLQSVGNNVTTDTTTFFWGNADGNDVITNVGKNDVVNLYNLTSYDQINMASTGMLEDGTTFVGTLTDGSTITVTNATNVETLTFTGAGATWKFNTASKTWSQA